MTKKIAVNRRRDDYVVCISWNELDPPPAGSTHLMAWADPFEEIEHMDDPNGKNNFKAIPISLIWL
jgi:hypothetical protein